jgi:integrase
MPAKRTSGKSKLPELPQHCQWWKGWIRVHIGVPLPLQAAVGQTALRRSLRTKDPRVAEYARLPVIEEFEAKIEAARLAVRPANVAARVTAKFGYSIHARLYGTDMTSMAHAVLAASPPGTDIIEVAEKVIEGEAQTRRRLDMVLGLVQQLDERLPETFNPDQLIASLPLADAHVVVTFESIHAAWASRQTNPGTIADYRTKLAFMCAFLAGKTITKLTDAERDAYLRDTDAATVTAEQAVKYLDELVRTKSPKTADNHFAALKAVFAFNAKPGRALKMNPFAGIETGLKSDPKDKRLPFEDAERDALLKAAMSSSDPVAKWATLIAGFSGATISEIVEAHPRDFGEVDGVPVFRIRSTYRAKNRGLKNDGPRPRTVPLHSSFAAGFLAYVATRKGSDDLFPTLKADAENSLTNDASLRLNKFIRRTLRYTDKRKVFHSWRHTIATMLEKLREPRVPKPVRFAITGHALPKGEGDGYIHDDGPDIHELAAAVARLSDPSASA